MTKIKNEKRTDNPTITITVNKTYIKTDPEAEIIIIGIEIIIIRIEAIQGIEITEMTKITTTLEIMIEPLTLYKDPAIILPYPTIEMLIILMELLLPLPPKIVPEGPIEEPVKNRLNIITIDALKELQQ
ncbi:9870_t:CDS:2, partial [Gigaspora margarita]